MAKKLDVCDKRLVSDPENSVSVVWNWASGHVDRVVTNIIEPLAMVTVVMNEAARVQCARRILIDQ